MAEIISFDSLRPDSASSPLFDGEHHGCETSVIAVQAEAGSTVALHAHAYTEVFVVNDGSVRFTVDGDQVDGGAGTVVVVPPRTPHGFEVIGPETLRMTAIHDTGRIVTDWR